MAMTGSIPGHGRIDPDEASFDTVMATCLWYDEHVYNYNHPWFPIPRWKRLCFISFMAYSNRSGPMGVSTLTPAPIPPPLPGFCLQPAGSPGMVAPLPRSVP